MWCGHVRIESFLTANIKGISIIHYTLLRFKATVYALNINDNIMTKVVFKEGKNRL